MAGQIMTCVCSVHFVQITDLSEKQSQTTSTHDTCHKQFPIVLINLYKPIIVAIHQTPTPLACEP
jgi:hypothetical protein